MMQPVDLERLTPAEQIVAEDTEETGLLQEMLQDAYDYIRSFSWCPPIDRMYLGRGVGGVVAVFLERHEPFTYEHRVNVLYVVNAAPFALASAACNPL